MSLVLDASAALSWIFQRTDASESKRSAELLGELLVQPAWVPSLWYIEVSNALLTAERRGVVNEAQIVDFLQRLSNLPIYVDDCDTSSRQEAIIALGRQLQLTAYDATYLDLSLRKNARLATFDRKLALSTQKIGGKTYF